MELRDLTVATLARIDEGKHPELAAKILHNYILRVFNEPEALAAIERAIPLFDRIGDTRAIIELHTSLTFIFAYRALIADVRRSAERVEELSAMENLQTSREYAVFLHSRAMLNATEALFDDARADIAAAEAIATAYGDEYLVIYKLKIRLIFIETGAGNFRRAIEIANEMLASELGTTPEIVNKANECLATLHLLLGEADAAEAAARVVLKAMRSDETPVVQYVAGIAVLRGHPHVAARLMGFIDALLESVPSERDLLQQLTWELLCTSIAKQLHPDVLALRRRGRRAAQRASSQRGSAGRTQAALTNQPAAVRTFGAVSYLSNCGVMPFLSPSTRYSRPWPIRLGGR